MKQGNLKRWADDPALDGLLFFAQRMDELLWDFTLDTHKPMALNAPYLCREALSLIENIKDELIESANLKHVLEELQWSVQHDAVAKSLLDLPITHYVLLGDEVKLSEHTLKLEALSRTLEPRRYLHKCFDFISDQVKNKQKIALDATARTLATTLINMGVSKRYLYQRVQTLFFGSGDPIDSVDYIDQFLKEIYPYAHEFTVYFVVPNIIKSVEESLDSFDIKLLSELPDDLKQFEESGEFKIGEGDVYVAIGELQDYDIYSAHETAARRIDLLSDLFNVFHHRKKIDWKPSAVVRQCCLDGPVMVLEGRGAMEKPFDLSPEKASKELNRFLQNFGFRGVSRERFNRVADLHGTCVNSDLPANQLVNLWTAIETLTPSKTSGTKIHNVLESMLPFLMTVYTRRLIQRFNHDLVRWGRWRVKRMLNSVPDMHGRNTLHRTLGLLAVPSNQGLRDALYKECGNYQLLRYRAFQLSDILKSPESLISALESHEKKLRWQIRRIYRTRNLIVHSGASATYINGLVENAHDYFDQIIFDVMKLACGEYRSKSVSQTFELAHIKHRKFMATLRGIDTFTAENCQFLCNDFDTIVEQKPWGYDAELSA